MRRFWGQTWVKWLVALVVIVGVAVVISLTSGPENYQAKYAGADLTASVGGIGRENTYDNYLKAHASAADATEGFEVAPSDALPAEDIEVQTEGLYMASGSVAQWEIEAPESGFYFVSLYYKTVASRGVDLERALYINGEIPFSGADLLTFTRMWMDGGEIKYDNQGNQIRPTQEEYIGWQTSYCKDSRGYYTEPYRIYLEKGTNTVALECVSEPMILGGLSFEAPFTRPTYEAYAAQYAQANASAAVNDFMLDVQGEDSTLRSSPSFYARYDRSSSATEPYNVYQTVLNYIGGDPWRNAGQWIEWAFEVPEDGFYNITIKARQNYSRGNLSCRSLYLDGEIPFAEMENIVFGYANAWNMLTLGDKEGNAYQFYLTKGQHTLRLEATMGDMGSILSAMDESIYRLNQIYRKILVLTGVTPDRFRDYKLGSMYPEAIEAMDLESKILYKLVDDAVAVTGQKSDRVAVAQTLAVQLEDFVDDPDKITKAFTNFKDNITSLGTAMQAMSETKLDIDKIVISGVSAKPKAKAENIFTSLLHEIRSCIASYAVDYNSLGDVYTDADADSMIEVWILTGRDQSTILKTMVDDTFTPATGIKVNVKLVDPGALLSAVVAGNGPDVVVSTDSWNPVNYALRHSAEDLRQFAGVDDVLADFYPSAYAAFEFEGGLYALPETQLCNVLFYREDILAEYGLDIPETWNDVIAMLPTLQGANMSIGIPYPDIVNPNLATYYAMLYQNGGAIYDERALKTTIGTEAGVTAFELYTSLYNDYGLPTVFDFVSRFRSGEMPLGIFDYTTFNTLTVSAPEIRGLWDIAILPGTERMDDNGNIFVDHSGHSQGACCMMIATDNEKLKRNCWEFMKWWVSTDAQVRFGREIESVLGSSARYPTANREAVEQLAWSEKQLTVIREQMQWAVGFREVAGGYYTNRHLTNAVRKVINEKTDQRETILDYARTINEEIVKKRLEFGLPLE